MAVSNYLGTQSKKEAAEQAHRDEQRHIDEVPEGQHEELRQIFAAKGFEGDTLERIVDTISRDRSWPSFASPTHAPRDNEPASYSDTPHHLFECQDGLMTFTYRALR